MLPFPPVIAWTLGAVGAVFMSKLLAREWRRVNAELEELVEGGMKRWNIQRFSRDQVPIEGFQVSEIEDEAMPLRNWPRVNSLGLYQAKNIVG